MDLKAQEGRCEEASPLSMESYIPCNAPAVAIVAWKNRSDRPIRMCAHCVDHNVKNRGGYIAAHLQPIEAQSPMTILDEANPSGIPFTSIDWDKVAKKTPPARRPRKGKYVGVAEHLPRTFGVEPTYQDKIDLVKAELMKEPALDSSNALAREYAGLRDEKDRVQAQLSETELRLKAVEQLLVDKFEADSITSLRTLEGFAISTHLEPRAQVVDKEAFRLWCIANGLERSLQLWPSTMNSLAKERLLAGEPEPDGVQLSSYTVVKLMRG